MRTPDGSREEKPTPQAEEAWIETEIARRQSAEESTDEVEVLPAERFSDEYAPADPSIQEQRGAAAGAIAALLCGSCAGWGTSPEPRELYDAMQATAPTPRQSSVINVLISEASRKTIALAYLQGAFTWRQLARSMKQHDGYSRKLAEYVNLHAERDE